MSDKGKPTTLKGKALNLTDRRVSAQARAKALALGCENIRPYQFKKGVVYNPKGQPVKEKSLTRIMRDIMTEAAVNIPLICQICNHLGLDPEQTTIGAVLASSLVAKGCQGKVEAIKEILNRVEGRVAMRVEMVDPSEVIDGVSYEDLMERAKDAIKRSTQT